MSNSSELSTNSAKILGADAYTLRYAKKAELLLDELFTLNLHQRQRCEPFNRICQELFPANEKGFDDYSKVPFLPVRLFKHLRLQSVPDENVLKVLYSSGTTSQNVSQVFLDRDTSILQTKALVSIVSSFIGGQRLPMIIVDSAAALKDPAKMSARGAGLVGLANFGRNHFYALNEEMKLNLPELDNFLKDHHGQKILVFGFTFMVWQYLLEELRRSGEVLQLPEAILIHSGGWKKLEDRKVSNEAFKKECQDRCGIRRIHNFYGMVEQVGGIYMECDQGFFHAPNMAEVLIRDPENGGVLPAGKPGLIQTLSVLPRSYPGHSILTEDLGVIEGVDDCPCGRMGTRFKVLGRMQQAELRGCSDTHAAQREAPKNRLKEEVVQALPKPERFSSVVQAVSEEFLRQEPLSACSKESTEFLHAISKEILNDPNLSRGPETAALGFWLRKGNLEKVVEEFLRTLNEGELLMPRGVCFHVAPSNVDTIFLYSWALSLLAGNINVVRISSKTAPEMDLLLKAVSKVFSDPRWHPFAARNKVLSYDRDAEASSYLSRFSDIRMLWGGDEAVAAIRSLAAKPNTKDVTFNDKFSYSLIFAGSYLQKSKQDREELAKNFWNDSYTFDQMACSSPRVVFFAGDSSECAAASAEFWKLLEAVPAMGLKKYQASVIMDKSVALCIAIAGGGELGNGGLFSGARPVVVRAKSSVKSCAGNQAGGGFFIEHHFATPLQLKPLIRSEDQTLTYYGNNREGMRKIAEGLCQHGIDRIVPIGQALNFSATWDGYILFSELTRRVTIV